MKKYVRLNLVRVLRVRFQGFTLIELLVVIAVIGVLAGALIIAINPTEQLSRGRDSQRKSEVSQLGRSIDGYVVANGAVPAASATWQTTLVNAGDLKKEFPVVPSTRACTNGSDQNNFCYATSGTTGYVFVFLESNGETKKCVGGVGGASSNVYYVYDTSTGRACIKCGGGTNYLTATACNAVQ